MRVPYADPSKFKDEDDKAIAERIVKRRKNEGGLLELDKALLNAPPLADGWNSFFGAIRTGTTISASFREMIMCRIAVLNFAWYEWEQHAPILRRSVKQGGGGMGITGLQYIWSAEPLIHDEDEKDRVVTMCLGDMFTGSESTSKRKLLDKDLTAQHYAVLQLTDTMTLQTRVPDEVFDEVKKHFNTREITELTMTIAGYNCCSRFLTSMNVGERNGKEGALKALKVEGAGVTDENLPKENMGLDQSFSLDPGNGWSLSDLEEDEEEDDMLGEADSVEGNQDIDWSEKDHVDEVNEYYQERAKERKQKEDQSKKRKRT